MTDSRHPIGRFQREANPQPEQIEGWLTTLEQTPLLLREAVKGLNEAQLDTPYRDGGWTVRQVIHHVADSHMHSYARFRFAMTMDAPAIKAYDEAAWAELPDAKTAPVELSLDLLDALHKRWSMLLRTFNESDFARTFVHPENGPMTLMTALQIYAWHGRHHTAHITSLRQRLAV